MKRRILSILLLAALVIGLLPQGMLSVSAYSETDVAYPVEGGNLYFDKATGTITDCDNSVTGADIPAQIDGVTVTGIGSNAFKDCGKLISVTLPKSVTSIGDNAFSGCTYLSSTCDGVQGVIIPANVTSIDSLAFFGCECLQSVYFEGDAPEIGENVFTIKDPDSLWVDDIYVEYINIPGLTLYYIDGCTGWSFETWNGYHTMLWSGDSMNPEYPPLEPTEPTEPEGFTAYPVEGGNLYFYSADGMIVDCDETVTYADVPAEIDGIAVTGIGSSAFEYCISLTGVTIPESVTSIDSYAFEGCESLQSACFLGDAPALGTDVFCMIEFVFDSGFGVDTETVVIPGLTLYYIDGKADWTRPTWNGYPTATWDGVNVPEPADEIAYPVEGGNLYFRKSTGEIYDCDEAVTAADIPAEIDGVNVRSIGCSAFNHCSLTRVTIPSSVTSIGDWAFYDCPFLISVTLPDCAASVGNGAFRACSSLIRVTIENPFCDIYDSADTINDGEMTVIYGCANSTAQAYAERYGYTFCLISDEGSGSAEEKPTPDEPTSDFITGTHTNSIADGDEVIIALTSKNKAVSTEITVNERGYTQMVAADIAIYGENLITKAVNTVYTVKTDENGKYSFVIDDKYLTSSEIGGDLTLAEVASDYSLWELEEAEGGWFIKNVNAVNNGNAQYLEYYNTFTAYRMNTNYPDSYTFNFYKVNRNTVVAFPVEDGNLYFDRETGTIIGCDRSATLADIPAEIDGIAVADIGDFAFSGCSNLTSVTIPESVSSIGDGAFNSCSSLTTITIPDSVTSIGDGAFSWSGLTSVTIPDSVTSIGEAAFYGCNNLQAVYFMGNAPALGDDAFKMWDFETQTIINLPGVTLYYIEGKKGWTSPTWNSYPTATWTPAAENSYTDVSEKEWYYDAVQYASQNGLMNGVGNGKFDPEGSMTRAMLVTVLWRYEGEPAEGENTFTDVPNGTWYTNAVAWAASNGIVGGIGNGKFDPEGSITREQMATILFRYAQKKNIDTSKRGELSGFADSGKVSSWAKDAVQWTVAEKIINGSDGKLLPQGNATRAQVSAILMRFLENIVKA